MPTYKVISKGGVSARIHSIAGESTCVVVPKYSLVFDVGKCPTFSVDYPRVFFTHMHMDHVGGIGFHCATRQLRKLSPPTYHFKAEFVERLDALLTLKASLEDGKWAYEVARFDAGDVFPLEKNTYLKAFPTIHPVPSQGYAIISTKKKLKEELKYTSATCVMTGTDKSPLRSLEGKEIAKMVRRGEEVFTEEEFVEFAFTGDTAIEAIEEQPAFRSAKLLVTECTFIDDEFSPDDAAAIGHIHVDHIAERAHIFEDVGKLCLTHFSGRYTEKQVLQILAAKLPPALWSKTEVAVGTRF